MPLPLLLLLHACANDNVIAYPVGDGGASDGGAETDGGGTGGDDTGPTTDGGTTGPTVAPGELVLTELMIDANAVSDEHGEWVEIYNVTDRTLSLDGLVLGDDNVDAWPLDGGVQVAPGQYAVLCADTASGANGGVSCDGAFHYNTWGEGFALANAGDEVTLALPDGTAIDRMSYGEAQVSPGVALGVDPGQVDATANDSAGAWCLQDSPLSGGDLGTPGQANDGC